MVWMVCVVGDGWMASVSSQLNLELILADGTAGPSTEELFSSQIKFLQSK